MSDGRWLGISQILKIGIQFFGVLLFANILSPYDYGVMAMGMVVVNFANLFKDMGVGAYIIKNKNIELEKIKTLNLISIVLGLIIMLVIMLSARIVALLNREERLSELVIVLALVFPLAAFSIVPQAILEKNLKFKKVAIVEVSATTGGVLFGILAAKMNYGYFSLAIQAITTAMFISIGFIWHTNQKIYWGFNKAHVFEIKGYSKNLFLFNLINYFSRNSDSYFVGSILGAKALGSYSLAYRFMMFPVQNMSFVLSRLLLPRLSSLSIDNNDAFNLYEKIINYMAMFLAPILAIFFCFRVDVSEIVLSGKWSDIPNLLTYMIPIGFLQSIIGTTGVIYMATGNTKKLRNIGAYSAILHIVSFMVGVNYGVQGVVIAYLVATIINFFPCLYFAVNVINGSAYKICKNIMKPVFSCLILCLLFNVADNYVAKNLLYIKFAILILWFIFYLYGMQFYSQDSKKILIKFKYLIVKS